MPRQATQAPWSCQIFSHKFPVLRSATCGTTVRRGRSQGAPPPWTAADTANTPAVRVSSSKQPSKNAVSAKLHQLWWTWTRKLHQPNFLNSSAPGNSTSQRQVLPAANSSHSQRRFRLKLGLSSTQVWVSACLHRKSWCGQAMAREVTNWDLAMEVFHHRSNGNPRFPNVKSSDFIHLQASWIYQRVTRVTITGGKTTSFLCHNPATSQLEQPRVHVPMFKFFVLIDSHMSTFKVSLLSSIGNHDSNTTIYLTIAAHQSTTIKPWANRHSIIHSPWFITI